MSRPALVQRLGRPFGVALLTASLLGQVQATTFSTLTLVQQAKKAEVIVQATIGTPSTVTEGGQSYAVYPLKVSETLAGDASQLPQVGGGPALYVLSSMDQAPVFQAGQEAVLLLYRGRLDSPLVGFNQGAYLIAAGQVSVLPVAGAPLPQVAPGSIDDPATPGAAQPGSTPANTQPGSTAPVTTPTPPAPPGAAQPGTGTGAPDTTGGTGNTAAPGNTGSTAPGSGVTPPTPPQGQGGTAPTTTPPATTPAVSPPAPTPSSTSGTPAAAPGTTPPVSPTGPTTPPAPTAAPTPAATPAPPPGVLGNIKTAAQLKAAIVAARAAK